MHVVSRRIVLPAAFTRVKWGWTAVAFCGNHLQSYHLLLVHTLDFIHFITLLTLSCIYAQRN